MDLGLKGRVALVLASSQGLGKASALSLAGEGAHVVICARRKEPLLAAQKEIEAASGLPVLAVPTNITQADQLDNLVEVVMKELGHIDVLVTNSGPPASGLFLDLTMEEWRGAIDGLLMSAVQACYKVIPIMHKQKWGRIIHITSTSIKQPLSHLMLSSAARLGVAGLSKITANQFAKDNILIHTICPGPFMTEAEAKFFNEFAEERGITPEQAQAEWVQDIPVGRIGDPQEFGDVVAFLASERASYMTGTVIQVDGGRVQNMI